MLLIALLFALPIPANAALEIVSCEAFSYVDPDDTDSLCLVVRGKVRNSGKVLVPKKTTMEAMVSFMGNCDMASAGGNPYALEKSLPPGETATVNGGGCYNHRAKREKATKIAFLCTEPGGGPNCFNLTGKNCTFDRSKIKNPKNFRECKIRQGKPE